VRKISSFWLHPSTPCNGFGIEGAMEEEVSGVGEGCLTQVVARLPVSRAKWLVLTQISISFPSRVLLLCHSIREERCWHQGKGSAK
jgi:hypothetical protein